MAVLFDLVFFSSYPQKISWPIFATLQRIIMSFSGIYVSYAPRTPSDLP